jgi:hypothetical protein
MRVLMWSQLTNSLYINRLFSVLTETHHWNLKLFDAIERSVYVMDYEQLY